MMLIILRSFLMSFGVALRVIVPAIGIFVATAVLASLFNPISGGLAGVVSGPISTVFLGLVGVRIALAHLGDRSAADHQFIFLQAVVFALIFYFAKGIAIVASQLIALAFAGWQTGVGFSVAGIVSADQSLQTLFLLNTFAINTVVGWLLYAAVFAVLAIPFANAARSSGRGDRGHGTFFGFGRQFVPVFVVYAVSVFLQFFLGLYHFVVAIVPLVIGLILVVSNQVVPNVEWEIILRGVAASFGLLWLQAWTWSACALALKAVDKADGGMTAKAPVKAHDVDVRELRKSRE